MSKKYADCQYNVNRNILFPKTEKLLVGNYVKIQLRGLYALVAYQNCELIESHAIAIGRTGFRVSRSQVEHFLVIKFKVSYTRRRFLVRD